MKDLGFGKVKKVNDVEILVLPPYSKYSRYYFSYDESSNTLSTYTYQREDEVDRTYYADTDVFGIILRDDVEWYYIDEEAGDVSVEWNADEEAPFVHTPIPVDKMKDLSFGKVEFGGKEYALTQQPYIDGPADGNPYYRAMAVDAEGDEYEVKWEVVENWEKIEDEQEIVEDWESPVSVKKL